MQDCRTIQDLLVKREIETISDEQERELEVHIKTCEDCKAFRERLAQVAAASQQTSKDLLSEGLRVSLLRRMRSKSGAQKSYVPWRQFFIRRRVAIYQTVAAAAIILFFTLITRKIGDSHRVTQHMISPISMDTEMLHVLTVRQVHQIVDSQKVGVTLSQDTVLSKILFTL